MWQIQGKGPHVAAGLPTCHGDSSSLQPSLIFTACSPLAQIHLRGQLCSVHPPNTTSSHVLSQFSLVQWSIGTEHLLQDFQRRWVSPLGSVPLVRTGDLCGQMPLAHESCLPCGLEIVPTSPKPQPSCPGCVLCPHERLLAQPLVFPSTL